MFTCDGGYEKAGGFFRQILEADALFGDFEVKDSFI